MARFFVFGALILSIFVLSILRGCVGGKAVSGNETEESKFEPVYPVSAPTKLFIVDLERELKEQDVSLEEFEPSEELIERYAITKKDGNYFIRGTLMINDDFNNSPAEDIGVSIGTRAGEILTATIPLHKLPEFFQLEDIIYLSIGEKEETER